MEAGSCFRPLVPQLKMDYHSSPQGIGTLLEKCGRRSTGPFNLIGKIPTFMKCETYTSEICSDLKKILTFGQQSPMFFLLEMTSPHIPLAKTHPGTSVKGSFLQYDRIVSQVLLVSGLNRVREKVKDIF